MGRFVAEGIEKLGPQRYRAWWREKATGKRRSKVVHGSLEDAKAFRKAMFDAQERGAYVAPDALTVGDYLEAWMLRVQTMGEIADSTQERHASLLAPIIAHLGAVPLQQLTKGQIEDYYATCLKTERTRLGRLISGDTVNKRHVVFRRALEDACFEEPPLIQRNPAARAIHPPPARPRGVAWTSDEAQVVLAAVHGSWLDLPVSIALHTGMRIGEVIGLRWRDVHLPSSGPGHLYVSGIVKETKAGVQRVAYGKTKHARRRLAISAELADALRAARKEQAERRLLLGVGWEDSGLVVCGRRGQVLRPSKVSGRFSPVVAMLEAEGVLATEGATFHSLRHTHATLLLRAGVPVHIVSARLGHSKIQITLDYYGHVIPGDDEAVAASFAGMLSFYASDAVHTVCTFEAASDREAASG